MKHLPLPNELFRTINSLNICQVIPTVRGCRGGIKRRRSIAVIATHRNGPLTYEHKQTSGLGVNKNNLVIIKCRPNYVHVQPTKIMLGVLNAQSARNKVDRIHDVIIEHDIDILALTETWLTSAKKDEFFVKSLAISGYKLYSVPRKGNKGYGGVAILYKSNLQVNARSSANGGETFEYCEILFQNDSKCLNVVVMYRPPPSKKNKFTTNMFINEFNTFMLDRLDSAGELVLVGDLNFHLDKPSDPESKRVLSLLESLHFTQNVSSATHRSGHILDVVITRDNEHVLQDLTVSDMISDHNLVLCRIHHPKPSPIRVTVTTRKMRDINMADIQQELESLAIPSDHDVVILTDHYNQSLTSILDHHAPAREKTITIRPSQPWFSDDIHRAKCEKRKLERRWRRTRLTIHKEMYCKSVVAYNKMLDSAQAKFYNNKIAECGNDSKAVSHVMKEILQQKKEVKLPIHSSAKDLANRFAHFFEDKVSNIRAGFPDMNYPCDFHVPLPECSFTEFSSISEVELQRIVMKSPSKGCSLDPLPTRMVKQVMGPLLPLMTTLINSSLTSGDVPENMKVARVSPLLKKPSLDSEHLQNYRPVSNLSFLSKLLEKVVAFKLQSYMDTHGLNDPTQSAYRTGHSTETALARVQNDLLCTIDKHGVAILVLLDLSAAFDTVDHNVLLDRMHSLLGIGGTVLRWFRSYLTGRTQQVQIHDALSVVIFLLFGVPQGSVLGPILFLIYMLPLSHLIQSHGLHMQSYADDTQLYLAFQNPKNADEVHNGCIKIERCLADIHAWMTNNKLKLNNDKTEIMLFGTKSSLADVNITSLEVAGTRVHVSDGPVRNLGVLLDNSLSMSSQVNRMVQSACFHLRNIGQVRNKLTESSTKSLVQSLVISRLDYGNSLLCGLPIDLVTKLQLVQNKAARLITLTKKRDHITPVLCRLHWLPVDVRINFKVLLIVYKAMHGLAPQYIRELLNEYQPTRQLRSSCHSMLQIPKTKTVRYGDRAFFAYAPKIWNMLPLYIRQSDTISCFKSRLKTHYFKLKYHH